MDAFFPLMYPMPNDAFEHHVIETDLEPDDIVTLIAHARKHHQSGRRVRLSLVVGEGDARIKVVLAQYILQLIVAEYPRAYWGHIAVIQGDSSPTPYPMDSLLLKEWLQGFDENESSLSRKDIEANYLNLYADHTITTVFMLKPPREAICLHHKIQLAHIDAHAYGGFNWHVTGATINELRQLAESYHRFNYLFRFTAIGEESLYQIKVPVTVNPLLHAVSKIILNWNLHMKKKAELTINDESDLGVLHNGRTSAKTQALGIIKSIQGKEEVQFVMADVLTMLCEPPTMPMYMHSFDGKEPAWIPDFTSTVFVHNVSLNAMATRRANLVIELDKLFAELATKTVD